LPGETTVARASNRSLDHTEANSKEAASMKVSRPRILVAVLAAATALGFGIGKITATPAAAASAAHRYTLRVGDKVTVPAVGQVCAVYTEGGAPELFCARPRELTGGPGRTEPS
jgi:hypothetical protein